MSPQVPYPAEAIAACRAVTRRHAKTFSFAAFLFPKRTRAACYAVYAFCRRADDAVDEAESPESARTALAASRARLERAYGKQGLSDADPEVVALAWAALACGVPRAPLDDLLDGMALDLTPLRLQTRAELERYCALAAGTVGRALAPALGAPHAASEAAEWLGKAMQLTNILRDVDEDRARGRVYLAADDLAGHGLTHADVDARRFDDRFRAFIAAQIARARLWYARAESGIADIPGRRARFGVRAMGVIYGAILGELERRGSDVYAGRAHVSGVRKLMLLVAVLAGRSVARPAFFPQHAHNDGIAQLQPHPSETNR